jgi:hypothetical protein
LVTFESTGDKICWTIPCFPVITLEFQKIKLQDGVGLCKASDFTLLRTFPFTVLCTSHCNIIIDDVEFPVFWDWSPVNVSNDNSEVDEPEEEVEELNATNNYIEDINFNDSDDENNENVIHVLPFKVLGVAHTKENQNHMEKCFLKKEENLPVEVKIQAEPENVMDRNAIAVHVNYNTVSWFRVGYIPSELTHYVHEAMREGKLVSTEIKHIKFRVHWLRVGFYMNLLIKKKGAWDNIVVLKSHYVQ